MSDPLDELVAILRSQEADRLRGRKVIVFAPVLAATATRVEHYRQLGVTAQLVVTFGDGTGPLPSGDDLTVVRTGYGAPVRSATDELSAWTRLLDDPPVEVLEAVERFDPTGAALVISTTPTASPRLIFGRASFGGRSAADEALEDKTLCGPIFTAAGLATAPEEIVAADRRSLRAGAARLDEGAGVVISADASHGLNGGASKVWWLRPGAEPEPILERVCASGRTARVMPFLEGQPCSIHGIVTDQGVLILRPVELCMLRPVGGTGFVQAGISSWWDPSAAQRHQMRAAARATGEVLARVHGYRGAFGIDGILTAEGFRAHELNPRFSGGISALNKGVDVPLNLLDQTVRSGVHLDFDADAVEQRLLDELDAHRFGTAYLSTGSVSPSETTTVLVTGTPDELRSCDDEGAAVGRLELGPAAMGGLVRFTPHRCTPGTRLTQWAAAALELADSLWHNDFGAMEQPVEWR